MRQRAEQVADTAFGTAISVSDETREAAARALSAIRAQTVPQTKLAAEALAAERGSRLWRLAELVGKPDVLRSGDDAGQQAFWSAYHDILGAVPIPVLDRACRAFIAAPAGKTGKWFPDPGTLLSLANADQEWIEERRIAKGLDRLATAPRLRDREPLDPDEEAAAWAEYLAKREALTARIEAEKAESAQADTGFSQRLRETGSLYRAARGN